MRGKRDDRIVFVLSEVHVKEVREWETPEITKCAATLKRKINAKDKKSDKSS